MDLENTNSAVIKQMLMSMKKETFILESKNIKLKYLALEPNFYNQNYEMKLHNLFKFCVLWHYNFWSKKKVK